MCKTIKQRVTFKAPPTLIYEALANSAKHSALTGQKAKIGRKIGDRFSAFAGQITGVNVDLVPGKRIVQAWRTPKFPVGTFSMAAVVLTPTENGGTELVLTHRGVPKALIPTVEQSWRQNYWENIRQLLLTKKRLKK